MGKSKKVACYLPSGQKVLPFVAKTHQQPDSGQLTEARDLVRGLTVNWANHGITGKVKDEPLQILIDCVDDCPACGEDEAIKIYQDQVGEVGVKGRVVFECQLCPFRWTFRMQEEIWNKTWIPSDPDCEDG
jgi:DNA-directed RNA polymerase subunit M/transcription elongation factor TFIIS